MKNGLELERRKTRALLPIHFKLPRHEIPLNTFIRTAEEITAIIPSFNQKFFDGTLEYEIILLPSEEGSFLSVLELCLLGGGASVWTFTQTDIGRAFIKGLTGHEPSYWAEKLGAGIRNKVTSSNLDSTITLDTENDQALRQEGANLIVSMTKSFMLKDETELKSIGVTVSEFREGFAARNNFYKACIATRNLQGIGFEEDHKFPIKRKDFVNLQVSLPPIDEDDNEQWFVDIVSLKVTSPNWNKRDKKRYWKAKDENNHERLFSIEDEHFWSLVKEKKLNTHIIDTIRVQWIFHKAEKGLRNIRVLKVLEFNDDVLSGPMDDSSLEKILGNNRKAKDFLPDLFGR